MPKMGLRRYCVVAIHLRMPLSLKSSFASESLEMEVLRAFPFGGVLCRSNTWSKTDLFNSHKEVPVASSGLPRPHGDLNEFKLTW